MMTSSNGNIFRVTGPLCGEFTGHRWIPRTKASDAELWCFLWSAPWIYGWVNNREAGDLRRHRAHYDVIVMITNKHHRTWVQQPLVLSHLLRPWNQSMRPLTLGHILLYSDVIMGAIASQITSLMIVYSTIYSCADQGKHQNSASLDLYGEFTGDRWIPRTNGQ